MNERRIPNGKTFEGENAIHDIDDAKRAIIDQIERSGRSAKTRLYTTCDFPASLITGALARLESENEIKKEVTSSGKEFYERVKSSPVQKILRMFSK